MNIIFIVWLSIYSIICLAYIFRIGKIKRIGVWGILAIALVFNALVVVVALVFGIPVGIFVFLSSYILYLIIESLANHKKPCPWCNNKENEALICGVCGKNVLEKPI